MYNERKEQFVFKFTNIIVSALCLLFVFCVALASVLVFYAGLVVAVRWMIGINYCGCCL